MVKTFPFPLSRPNAELPEAALAAGVGAVLLYLGFREGGYEPIVFGATAATLWWLLGIGLIFGLLPARRPGRASIALLGILLALTALTAVSLAWTLSPERTMAEAVRVAGLLALAALVVLTPARRAETIPAAVAAVGVIVAIAALVSRFEPGLGGPADDVVAFLPTTLSRLSFPLGYWNSLGALMAMAIPLLLTLASGEGARVARALAAGAVPAVLLVGFYTLSRGALLALIAACVLLVALHPRRTALLQTVALTALAGSILIWAAGRRGELADGLLTPTAESQGFEMALIAVAVVAVVSLVHGARRGRLVRIRPIRRRPSRRVAGAAAAVLVALTIAAAAVADAPEAVSERWEEFKDAGSAPSGTSRLSAAGGRGRYQWWDVAVDAGLERPISGIGPGTYEFRWSEAGTLPEPVRDAHSLYLESFAELGLPGFLLIIALVGGSIVGGGIITRRAPPEDRAALASMVAGCGAFAASAAVDWSWEMTVLPAAFIVLAAGVVSHPLRSAPERDEPLDLDEAKPAGYGRATEELDLDDGRGPRTLAVTAAGGDGDAIGEALGLAAAAAEDGLRAIVVETDLASPSLAARLGVRPSPGLRDYLDRSAGPQDVMRILPAAPGSAPIVCVPAGEQDGPTVQVAGRRFESLAERLPRTYDLVIFCAPPLLADPEAAAVTAVADDVIAVAPEAEPPRSSVTAGGRGPRLRLPVRGAAGTAAVLVALATTIPTASVALLESSREHASRGELQPAFDDASGAASVAPWAASPRLQQALILEEAGALALATEYAKQAIERESANWQNWLTLARIEAKRGRLRAASAAFGEAERRNPRSGLFDEPVTSLATDDPSSG